MLNGVLTSIGTTLLWILVHLLIVRLIPRHNRTKSSLWCYLSSLPLAYIVFNAWAGSSWSLSQHEAPLLGVIYGLSTHTLLFMFYVEVFYHADRSLTLNILTSLADQDKRSGSLIASRQPDLQQTVSQRIDILIDNGYVNQRDEHLTLTRKGQWVSSIMAVSLRCFPCRPQTRRSSDLTGG